MDGKEEARTAADREPLTAKEIRSNRRHIAALGVVTLLALSAIIIGLVQRILAG